MTSHNQRLDHGGLLLAPRIGIIGSTRNRDRRKSTAYWSIGIRLTTILRLLRSLPAYPDFGDGRTRLHVAFKDPDF